MNEEDMKILQDYGFEVYCESPFEIGVIGDHQSQASGECAELILEDCREAARRDKKKSK